MPPPDPLPPANDSEMELDANGNRVQIGTNPKGVLAAAGSGINQYQVGQGTINVFQGDHPELPGKPRVALVHFADDGEAAEVRMELQRALMPELRKPDPQKRDFILLPDGDPVVNKDQWHRSMYLWIGLAHIVVLLVSPSALTSKWFLRACEFLRGRVHLRSVGKDKFVVLPVLFDVAQEDFAKHPASSLAAVEKQIKASGDAEADVAEIMKRLKDLGKTEPEETAMGKMARTIANHLKESSRPALRNVAGKLGLDVVPDCHADELRIQVAGALWYAEAWDWEAALEELRSDPNIDRLSVLDLIVPSWVNPLAAHHLVMLFDNQTTPSAIATLTGFGGRAIVVQGKMPDFTGGCFLRRAHYAQINETLFVAIHSTNDAQPLANRIKQVELALKDHVSGDKDVSDETWQNDLKDHLSVKPLFIVFGPPEPDEPALTELWNSLPHPSRVGLSGMPDPYSIVLVLLSEDATISKLRQRVAFAYDELDADAKSDLERESYASRRYAKLKSKLTKERH